MAGQAVMWWPNANCIVLPNSIFNVSTSCLAVHIDLTTLINMFKTQLRKCICDVFNSIIPPFIDKEEGWALNWHEIVVNLRRACASREKDN